MWISCCTGSHVCSCCFAVLSGSGLGSPSHQGRAVHHCPVPLFLMPCFPLEGIWAALGASRSPSRDSWRSRARLASPPYKYTQLKGWLSADHAAMFVALCLPQDEFCLPDVPYGPTTGAGLMLLVQAGRWLW